MKNSFLNPFSRLFLKYKIHFIAWFIFIFYETIILGFVNGFGTFGNYAVHYTYNILIFYVHARYLLPLELKVKKRNLFLLPLLIIEVFLCAGLIYTFDYIIERYTAILTFDLNTEMFYRFCYRTALFIGFSSGYYALLNFLKEREANVILEKQHLIGIIKQQDTQNELNKTVNAYLKAQINPHFLFNTLNFIYNHTRKTAPVAAEAIMTLSDMMRYAVRSENADEFISLTAEIKQVENLIHLHQLRQNNTLQMVFDYSGITEDVRFIPLVLMTLAENIFKHGNLTKASKPAILSISVNEGRLFISSENLVNEHRNQSGEGIGLDNIQKRLLHAYHDKAVFNHFLDKDDIFHVNIVLNLV